MRSGPFTALLLFICGSALAGQCATDAPVQYKKFFRKNVEGRSMPNSVLAEHGVGDRELGRSFALVAGISHYPNLPDDKRALPQAKVDVNQLVTYLTEKEYFDEIVVLEDGDVTLENLNYFLGVYFPDRMGTDQKSRFLFAYSGHGFDDSGNSYLLTSSAEQMDDRTHSIDLDQLKVAVEKSVSKALNALVLLNSCQGGSFLGRIEYGDVRLIVPRVGAHAITAGAKGQATYGSGDQGRGSYFFEEVLNGLKGYADTRNDGLITDDQLYSFVRREVEHDTNGDQDPAFGDIEPHTSQGSFFFVRPAVASASQATTSDVGTAVASTSQPTPSNAMGPPVASTNPLTASNDCLGALTLDYYAYAISNNLQDDFLRWIDPNSWQRLKEVGRSGSSSLFAAGKSFLGGNYSLDDDYDVFDHKRSDHFKTVYYSRSYDQALSSLQATVGTREYSNYSSCLRGPNAPSGLSVWAARETLDEIELHVRYASHQNFAIMVTGEISGGVVPGIPNGHLWNGLIEFISGQERQFLIKRDLGTTQTVVSVLGADSVTFRRADGILTTSYVGTADVPQVETRRVVVHTPENNENRGSCPNEVGHHDGKYCTSRTTLQITTAPPRFLKSAKVDCGGSGCPWSAPGPVVISQDGLTATAYVDNWGPAVDAMLTADEYERVSASQCGTDRSVPVLRGKPVLIGIRKECLPVAMIKWTLLPDLVEGIFPVTQKPSGEVLMNGSPVENDSAVFISYSLKN
jgi:hypothetical protein